MSRTSIGVKRVMEEQSALPPFYQELERQRKEREAEMTQEKRARLIRVREVGPLYDRNDATLFHDHEPFILSNGDEDKNLGLVDVIVDPRISAYLTEPQKEGIETMYNYLTKVDWQDPNSEVGFILADIMGMGKTVQCIAVLWTFLTQSGRWNFKKNAQDPTIRKAIIICPASLRENWVSEIKDRIAPIERKVGTEMSLLVIDKKMRGKKMEDAVKDFMRPENQQQCLIISYEGFKKMRKNHQPLATNPDGIVGLVICDEAHLLKNHKGRHHRAVYYFQVKTKIVVTGTPLQNNVMEYGSIIRYVDRKFHDKYSIQRYKAHFQIPIELFTKGKHTGIQQPSLQGQWEPPQLVELRRLVKPFFLRRTQNPLVTVKAFHHLIFCKMMPDPVVVPNGNSGQADQVAVMEAVDIQKFIYNKFVEAFAEQQREHQLRSPQKMNGRRASSSSGRGGTGKSISKFVAGNFLRSLCAHPKLIEPYLKRWRDTPVFSRVKEALEQLGLDPIPSSHLLSAKMRVLIQFLKRIKGDSLIDNSMDRVVVASCHTKILDLIQDACRLEKLQFATIRGSMSQEARKKIIDEFNNPWRTKRFILTLSTKAGGFGINLIGANHFIIFEPDWNPHNDDQAMGRIFRSGQTKDCHFYRLATTGSIEEAVLEKQIFKKKLAGVVMDDEAETEQVEDEKEGIILDDGEFIPLYVESDEEDDCDDDDDDNEDEEEVEGAPVSRRDPYYHLTEPIKDNRANGRPFVSLVHDDLDCQVCKVREGDSVTDPFGLVGYERRTKDELNLRDWFHRFEAEDVEESPVVAEAWTIFPNDISMVMTKDPNVKENE